MKYLEIRKKYLDFFKSKEHFEIPSASLIPENDPSLLFTNAGMSPLVPYLLGETHPGGKRLVNSQRCLRTGDIDEVGDESHCTTFEMLGNWSLNDYFKKEAIGYTMEFFIEVLRFDINKIYASVFQGDSDAPKDEDSIQIWKEVFKKYGIDTEAGKGQRIQELPKRKNWWELEAGGPCGPDSEIFFDTGKGPCGNDCDLSCDCGKYVEIGNNVFMQYLKKDGKYLPLGKHNVDFGGGLDRLAMILQNVESFFETDIYFPIFKKVQEISENENIKSQRIITDHIKAATWIIADGVSPSRTLQGYVLRRLIRRSVRHARNLGIDSLFTRNIGSIAIDQFSSVLPALSEKKEEILNILEEEEIRFGKTLEKGLREFEKISSNITEFKNENGESFMLYETYGFPIEITIEELKNKKISFDESKVLENHEKAFQAHQEKSRTASKGLFKGGLADTSDMSKKYHTLNHLLLSTLYNVLGNHIYQKGSNITPERLRLDFPHPQKLTEEELKKIENMVNEQISKALPISFKEMVKEEALKLVKYASFTEKYPDIVKVYIVGSEDNPFSVEICGGPHVQNTSELGRFKIIKEEGVALGIRRIKAILE